MSWHKGERATVLGGLIIMVISLCYYTVSVPLIWDFSTLRSSNGLPLAADYATFWSASKLALSGKPADVYNIDELHKKQQQSLGSHHRHGVGWYYPPNFLLMVLPLGLMPYLISFFVWIIGTLILYLIVLYRISPHPILFSLLLFFPGIYENFMFGQNGFLTGTLLGGGLLLLDSYPVAAGCLLAFLSYKPQFIILVFPALICGRYWKTLAGAFTTSLLMLLISIMAFGYQVWIEYFQVMSIPMKQLEIGMAQWTIMPTFFAAVLSAGFGVKAAYLVQGVIMMAVVAGVSWVWCQKTSIANRRGPGFGHPLVHSLCHYLRPRHPGPPAWLALGRRSPQGQAARRVDPFTVWLASSYCRSTVMGPDKFLKRKNANRARNSPGALPAIPG